MPLEIVTAATAIPLENDILRRIRRLQEGRPFLAVLIVAPTARILVRLRRVLMAAGEARCGLHLLHHRSLERAVIEAAGETPLRLLRGREQRALLARVLASGPWEGPLARWAREQPGALAALHASLRDLREANLPPEAAGLLGQQDEVLPIYARYCEWLEKLAGNGLGDSAALAAQAARCAGRSRLVGEAAALLHHGAYDLTGVHRALIERIAGIIPVTLFVPGCAPGPAFEHARELLRRTVSPSEFEAARCLDGPEEPAAGVFAGRLGSLYEETAAPGPVEASLAEVMSSAGAEAELESVARRILSLRTSGIALEDMAIIARSLEPYAPHIERILLREHGLPLSTSAEHPLRRDPAARAFRDLLLALARDFEARDLMDFLRSPAARIEPLLPPKARCRPDRWDRLRRRARIIQGLDAWTRDLVEWAADRVRAEHEGRGGGQEAGGIDTEEIGAREKAARADLAEAETLSAVVAALANDRARWGLCATWREHAAFLAALARERLRDDERSGGGAEKPGPEALHGLIAGLAGRDLIERATGGVRRDVGIEEACRAILEAIEDETIPAAASKGPGVAVLDMMQARGLSFRVVFWIGLNSSQLPRRPHQDPFLPDSARRLLREKTGAAVPVKDEAIREERLLAALTLGAAREKIVLSWQRADEEGRGQAPALVVRELARVLAGRPESRALLEEARAGVPPRQIPFHPVLRAERAAAAGELVSFRDAACALAARSDDPARAIESLPSPHDRPQAPDPLAVEHAVRTGSFDPGDLSRDGSVGRTLPVPERWSPKRFQMIGECPLRYFFYYGLGVRDSERLEAVYVLDPAEMGECAHGVLKEFWSGIIDEEGLPRVERVRAGDLGAMVGERITELFRQRSAPIAQRVSRLFPGLWQSVEERWLDALMRAAYLDLRRVLQEEARVGGLEKTMGAVLDLEEDQAVRVEGRVDRLDILKDGSLRVVDYKTGGDPEAMVDISAALKGRRMQMALYREMASESAAGSGGGRAIVQVLPVGPRFGPDRPEPEEAPVLDLESRPQGAEIRRSFLHTLGVLVRAAREGRFPLNKKGPCDTYCEYERACRRSHPPSVARVMSALSYRPYFALGAKSTRSLFPGEGSGEAEG